MAVARIKLLRNRKVVQIRQMRREVGQLLEANQDMTARIRVRAFSPSLGSLPNGVHLMRHFTPPHPAHWLELTRCASLAHTRDSTVDLIIVELDNACVSRGLDF